MCHPEPRTMSALLPCSGRAAKDLPAALQGNPIIGSLGESSFIDRVDFKKQAQGPSVLLARWWKRALA